MKALILWGDPPESSVVDKDDLRLFGTTLKAKFEGKWLKVKVVAENGKFHNLIFK